jgi:hypothetical protein
MDWKMKLALAMGAFVSMPVASVANACSNELTARRRLRRRRVSVPARVVPGTDQSLRVNVSLPSNEARRVPAACNSYRVKATVSEIQKSDSDQIFPKVEIEQVNVTDGAILEFDLGKIFEENSIFDPKTVSARVEVTPTDAGSCATVNPVASFVLKDDDCRRTFLPSQALNPVHLRPLSLGGPIIIKGPIIKE